MISKILEFLRIPTANKINKDGPERIKVHARILEKKKITQSIFKEFYDIILLSINKHFYDCRVEEKIELGAGSSFLKKVDSSFKKSDVVYYEDLDFIVDACNMKFKDNSIKCFAGIFFFHHIQNPYVFLDEVVRCCDTNGGVVLIEPYNGPLSRFLHNNMHDNEFYDLSASAIKDTKFPMSDANQALSDIIFFRDKEIFKKKYPTLKIVEVKKIHSYLRYIVSGGVNFKQLLPDFCIPVLKIIETILKPISHLFCVHYLIVIKKIN